MVYQRKVLLGASLFLSGLIVAAEAVQAAPRVEATATIRFKAPTKLDLPLSEAQRRGVNVQSIQVEQKTGVGWFNIDGKDQLKVTTITNECWKSYDITLQDLFNEPGEPALGLMNDLY